MLLSLSMNEDPSAQKSNAKCLFYANPAYCKNKVERKEHLEEMFVNFRRNKQDNSKIPVIRILKIDILEAFERKEKKVIDLFDDYEKYLKSIEELNLD